MANGNDPKRGSYAEHLRLATSTIRGWQAENAQRREYEPIAHPVAPDRVVTSSGEEHVRHSVHDRHPLDAMYADSTYEALGRDRRVKVRPGGTRADSIVAFQNKYRATPEVTEELYDVANEVQLPSANGLSSTEIAFGMAHEETDFEPSEISGVGARGVLQIRPELAGVELGYTPDELESDNSRQLRASLEYAKREMERAPTPEEGLGWYNQGERGFKRDGPTDYARRVLGKARKQPK